MPGQNWQGFQYDPNKGPIEQQLRAFLAGRPFFGSSPQMDPRWMTTASVLNGGDDGGYRNVQIATNPNARGNSETGMYYVGPDGRDYNRIPLSRADSSTGLSAAELGIGNDPYLVQTVMGISPQEWANYSEQDKQNILNQAYFKPDNLHGFGDIQYSPDGGVVTSTSSIRDPNIRHDNWLTAGMFAAVAGPALAGAYGGAGAPDMFGPGGGLAPEEAAGTGWGGTTPAGGAGGATGGAGGAAGGGAAGGATGGLGSLATPGNLIRGAGLAASLAGGGGAGGMGGGGGGGGGSGNMQYQWSDEMRPRWQRNLDRSEEISNRPYSPYTGQRIAGLSPDEQMSMGGLRDLVANGGTALGQAGSDYTMGMLGGSGLTGMFADPYANMGNRYSGESPEFQNVINSGLRDMGDAYDRVARDTNRRAAAAGVFGGSDHNANADVNEGAYGKRVADFVSGMRNDQYQRSAGLEESRLGRGSSAWQAGLGRMSGAARMAQGDQAQALARLGALGQAGGIQRGINQSQNDFDYQQYVEGRDWDRNQAGWLTGMFGTAQGGQFPTGGGQGNGSNAMNWAGLGLSAAGLAGRLGLFNGWGSGSDMWASGTGSPWYSGMDAYG